MPSATETQLVAFLCTQSKLSSFQCPAGSSWSGPCHLPNFISNHASSAQSAAATTASSLFEGMFLSWVFALAVSAASLGSCKFLSPFGSQLHCHFFKKGFAVYPIGSLALFLSECLDSQRSWSFISSRFHCWSPGQNEKLLKCRAWIYLFFAVPSEPGTVLGTDHIPRDTLPHECVIEWVGNTRAWLVHVVTWNCNYDYHVTVYDGVFRFFRIGK